jgi:hypothetical protein
MEPKKILIYPFLLECCQYSDDIFWKNIFEDLSYGICPYGTYINKNFLCCSFKGKEFNYKLIRKDSKILFDELYDIFTNTLGILSSYEKLEKKKIVDQICYFDEEHKNHWNIIKKKSIKDLLFFNFVLEKQKEFNLTKKDGKYLLSMIQIFTMFKLISSKDINYKDGKIIGIKNFDFEDKKILIDTSILDKKSDFKDDYEIKQKIKLSDFWNKYLKSLF